MYSLYLCYFTFGFCLTFGSIAISFEMMETLKFTPVEMTMAYGIIAGPWCVKPIFGMISDSFKCFDWGKRRPYIFMNGLLVSYIYMMVPKFILSKESLVLTMTSISACMCFADVCADCVTVDLAKKEKVKGSVQGTCWTSRAMGSVLGSAFGGSAYTAFGTKVVFQIMSIPTFMMAVNIWSLTRNNNDKVNNIWGKLLKNLKEKRMLAYAIFTIAVAPNYGPLYTFYLRKVCHFEPIDFQTLTICGSLSFLCSTFVYKNFLLKMPMKKLMMVATIGSGICQMTQIIVVSGWYTGMPLIAFDTVAESFFGILLLMPLIVTIAHNAHDGVEGTFYALLMAVSNFSAVIADELGGISGSIFGVTKEKFDNMPILVFLCAIIEVALRLFIIQNKSFAVYMVDKGDHLHSDNTKLQGTHKVKSVNTLDSLDEESMRDSLDSSEVSPVSRDHMLEMSDRHTRVKSENILDSLVRIAQKVMPPRRPYSDSEVQPLVRSASEIDIDLEIDRNDCQSPLNTSGSETGSVGSQNYYTPSPQDLDPTDSVEEEVV